MDPVIPLAWRESNAIQRDVLLLLEINGPATGAELHDLRGERPATESTTHRNLVALRERGLIESETDADDARAYENRLTDDGRELVTAYRDAINA